MPTLDSTTARFQVKLGAAGAPNLRFSARYQVLKVIAGGRQFMDDLNHEDVTNGTTAVDIMPATASADLRHVLMDFYLVQSGAGTQTVILQFVRGATVTGAVQHDLAPGFNLRYT